VYSLVLEVLDGLPRRSGSAEHHPPALPRGDISKLRPLVQAELEALETLEWLRDLTDEELARRRAFVVFLAAIGRSEQAGVELDEPPARERVLAALRYGPATNPELQESTGAKAGTVRDTLCLLVYEGEVVAEEGHPMTYRLARVAGERGAG
jgi:predicted Rossmann fold nucleotide-binding protein DprA/Smf involved in DNA uptake